MKFDKAKTRLVMRDIQLLVLEEGRATMLCSKCDHVWTTDLHGVLYGKKRGCPRCASIERTKRITAHRKTNNEIDQILVDNNIPITRIGHYINNHTKVEVLCNVCGHKWMKSMSNIIHSGHRCPRCSKRERITNEVIDRRLIENNRNITRIGESKGSMGKIEWECNSCGGHWFAKPNDIFSPAQSGCPCCSKKPFSKMAMSWLEYIEQTENIIIQHAGNVGEFRIPNTNYFADGYCESTNTIYEFHGDRFHGNPKLFAPDEKCHPYDNTLSAGELYKRTKIKREQILKSGFTLIEMWENDWKSTILE